MSSLIRREDVLKVVRECPRLHFMDMVSIMSAVNGIPAELEKFVRCRDCKFWYENGGDTDLFRECRWREDEETFADDYCSYGELKEL